jgi:hypothetical protein
VIHVIHTIGQVTTASDNAQLFTNQGQLLLNIGIGVLLPMLVALVTHRLASGAVKTLLLLALSLLGGLLANVTVASFRWQDFLTSFLLQFETAAVAHFSALKPLGITGAQGVIATAVPAGVGAPELLTPFEGDAAG